MRVSMGGMTLQLACTIALLLVALPSSHGADPAAPAPTRRVLVVGNELLRDTNVTWMLHALFQSAGGWGGESGAGPLPTSGAGATDSPSVVWEHYHDGYSLGPNPFADDFDPAAYEHLDALADPEAAQAPAPDLFHSLRPTGLAHAYCPGTLRLLNRSSTPQPWDVVVLQDHTAAALVPWFDAHSTRPGLAILTRAILQHSPAAKVLLLEGWMRDVVTRDFGVARLQARLAERAAAESDPERRAALESPSPPGGAPAFTGGSYELNPEAVLQIIEHFYSSMRDKVVADAAAAAAATEPAPGLVLPTPANFALVPVGDTWRRIAQSQSLSAETQPATWGDLYRSTPPRPPAPNPKRPPPPPVPVPTDPVSETDAMMSGRAAMPTAVGGFAIAAALFTSIARIQAPAVGAAAYCPCNMPPPAPVLGYKIIESPAARAKRFALTGSRCAMVRDKASETFAALYPEALTTLPQQSSWIDVDDRQELCQGADPFAPDEPDWDPSSSTGAASDEEEDEDGGVTPPLPSDQSTGTNQPDEEEGEGTTGSVVPFPIPKREPDPPPANAATESDGSVPPPSLGPVIAIVVLLMVIGGALLLAFWYRSRSAHGWHRIDSRDYQPEQAIALEEL